MSHDQHPFRIFRPAQSPPWLPQVLGSIEDLFRRVMPTFLRLHDIETAELPTAANENRYGLLYDKTDDRLSYSTGAAWVQLQGYDAAVASIAALSIVQGDLIYGSAADTFSRLAKDTNATRYLSNTGTSNNPAWAQVNVANGVSGTLAVANGGTGVTSSTGTGNVVLSASPTLTGTLAAAAATFSGNVTLGDAGTDIHALNGSIYGANTGAGVTAFRYDGVSGAKFFCDYAGGGDNYFDATVNHFRLIDGTAVLDISSAGTDVTGLARCDSFRIDQTPTAETPTPTHTFTISLNGTTYRIPCVV